MSPLPPLISVEDHYASPHIKEAVERSAGPRGNIKEKLLSLGSQRLKEMDSGAISLQIISHGPIKGSASIEECRLANNDLAQACRENPTRFGGSAVLPMHDPVAAAEELERCVKELGFVWTLVNNHIDGKFYDGEEFLPVFEKTVELDVPVYLHHTFPSDDMMEHYKGNYPDMTAFRLSIASWGWHSETGLHVLRLFAAGLFDKLAQLKIVLG
jgi:predicted TIM-barrel fold metal-dependent hydrolase